MKLNIAEQDIIFLSYDEPNCEKNYVDLVSSAAALSGCNLFVAPLELSYNSCTFVPLVCFNQDIYKITIYLIIILLNIIKFFV